MQLRYAGWTLCNEQLPSFRKAVFERSLRVVANSHSNVLLTLGPSMARCNKYVEFNFVLCSNS